MKKVLGCIRRACEDFRLIEDGDRIGIDCGCGYPEEGPDSAYGRLACLRLEDGKFYAYGTPWSGKTAQNRNVRVELGGICVLRRGTENKIAPYTGRTALHDILEQTVRPRDPAMMGKLLDILEYL